MPQIKLSHPRTQQLLHLIALILFITLAYYPSLDAPFVFDDFPNIIENPWVQPETLKQFGDLLHSPIATTRPLAMFSFAINFWLDGLDVFWYHVFNILLHIGNALLVYKIITVFPGRSVAHGNVNESTYNQQNIAFWSAALWAVNPVQTQAVTYIVQRMTSMAAFFYLLALYIFLQWRSGKVTGRPALLLIAICLGLGLASKEILLTLPITLLLLDHLYFSKSSAGGFRIITILTVTAVGALGLFYLDGRLPDWSTTLPDRNFSPWERVMTEWRIIWHYLSVYIVPIPERLHLAYDPQVSTGLLKPWTTLPSLLAILATGHIAWHSRRKYPAACFGILFYFLALATESTFANLELAFIHRLYLPSAFLIFAGLFYLPVQLIRKAGIFFLLLIALWSFWTINRNEEWSQGENFWKNELTRGSAPGRALNNQAARLIEQNNFTAAIAVLEKGLASNPAANNLDSLVYNLSCAYFLAGDYPAALRNFKVLQETVGPYRDSLMYVGLIYIQQDRLTDAEELADLLAKERSRQYQGQIIAANLARKQKNFAKAEEILNQSIQMEAKAGVEIKFLLKQMLANLFLEQGKVEEAYKIYLEITREYPHSFGTWKRILAMLEASGKTEQGARVRRYLEAKGVKIEQRQPLNTGVPLSEKPD